MSHPDWSRPCPQPLVIPNVMTFETLARRSRAHRASFAGRHSTQCVLHHVMEWDEFFLLLMLGMLAAFVAVLIAGGLLL